MKLRKELYLKISKQLEGVEKIQHVDLWKSQLPKKTSDNSYPFGFPAAFISIADIDWEDMTQAVQEGQVNVSIYIFFERGGDTFDTAIDKEQSLAVLDTITNIIDKVQWLSSDNFRPLCQNSEADVTSRFGRPAYMITFNTTGYNQLKTPHHVFNQN